MFLESDKGPKFSQLSGKFSSISGFKMFIFRLGHASVPIMPSTVKDISCKSILVVLRIDIH